MAFSAADLSHMIHIIDTDHPWDVNSINSGHTEVISCLEWDQSGLSSWLIYETWNGWNFWNTSRPNFTPKIKIEICVLHKETLCVVPTTLFPKISTIISKIPVTVMNVFIFPASILGILNAYNYCNITVMLVYYCNVMIIFRLRELETEQ